MREVVFDVFSLLVGLSGIIALVIILLLLALTAFGCGYLLGWML